MKAPGAVAVLLVTALLVPARAFANCSIPAGIAGDIIYNSTYNVVQFCNGTNWVNTASTVASTIGTLTNGDICTTNGTVINCTLAGSAGQVLGGTGANFTATPTLGSSGTTGTLSFTGSTSGTVTIQPQATAGTYNFNLPTTAGSAGQVLTSQGGGASAMTWTTLGSTVNSGTQYQLAYYASTGTAISGDANITTDASNDLLVSSGKVGIGVASPTYPLDVRASAPGTGNILAKNTSGTGYSGFDLIDSGGTLQGRIGYDNANTKTIINSQNNSLRFQIGGLDYVTLNTSGSVGIGTNAPQGLFDTAGKIFASAPGTTGDPLLMLQHTGTIAVVRADYALAGGSMTPLTFWTNGAEQMRITTAGNVGIGTAVPNSVLQVRVGTDQNVAINSSGGVGRLSSYNDAFTVSEPLIVNGSDLRFTDNGVEAVRITGGLVGIGQTNPDALLEIACASGNWNCVSARTLGMSLSPSGLTGYVNARFDSGWDLGRDTTSGGIMNFYSDNGTTFVGAGSISVNGSTTSYGTSSDRRLKENITGSTSGLAMLVQIPVREFNFITDPAKKRMQGFIAQDLERVYPEAVSTNGDNGETPLKGKAMGWAVDYGRVTPLIVKAVQELKAENDNLRLELKTANDNFASERAADAKAFDQLRRELDELRREIHAH